LKPRNTGLLVIHIRIYRVFRRNLLVEEGLLGIRDIGLKREPKKDLSCIILHISYFIKPISLLKGPCLVLVIE
jgi:hypothetical protein